MMPVPLSYFSPLVGGLPGQPRLGMEPTYYWDGLTEEARAWLRATPAPGQTIQFATFPDLLALPPRDGRVPAAARPRSIRADRPGSSCRTGPASWTAIDRAWVERSRPAFTVPKFGVPLVWVFPYAESEMTAIVNAVAEEGAEPAGPDARVVWLTPDRHSQEHAVTISHGWSMRS